MIVIVSSDADEHARAVMDELRAKSKEYFLLDMSAFPQEMVLALAYNGNGGDFRLRRNGQEISLADCRAVWWRRPGYFVPDPTIRRESHVQFIYGECGEAFAGLWHLMPASWINHPKRDEVAGRKVYQLKVAHDVGLITPQTLVSNDVAEARAFIERMGTDKVIYKAFSATQAEWRETRLMGQAEMELLDSVRFAPVIFQEYIEAEVDLRITVVGDQIFAAAIHSQDSAYKFDFRMDMPSVKVEAVKLPDEIESKLLDFMRHYSLVYGAIDMRKRPNGEYVFLEINPAGQWLFIEGRTGQKITAALAEKLIAFDEA
ncbi:MAG TPA: hypothetical protein VF435_06235 [Pyrinomonadaceae bacterium]